MNKSDQMDPHVQGEAAHRWLCDVVTNGGTPGDEWRSDDADCTVIERTLRTVAAISHGLAKLEHESVVEARVQGRSWEEIGAAMFQSPDVLARRYREATL